MTGDREAATVGGGVTLRDGAGAAGADAQAALERAREHLLSLQDPGGWWKGELETNVTMDAEDILLREFLGIRDAADTERSAVWIRSQQRSDGSWANFYGGPGDLSTTVEAYVALRLAGDEPDAAHMRSAAALRARCRRHRAGARVHPHLAGAVWRLAVAPGPGTAARADAFARRRSCSASTTSPAGRARPSSRSRSCWPCVRRALPFRIDELRAAARTRSRGHSATSRALALARPGAGALRSPCGAAAARAGLAARRALDRARQEADGSWGGIQPPWVYSLIALHLRGYPLDHPLMRAGLDGLERFTRRGEPTAAAWRPASRRSGTRRWRSSRSPTPESPADDPALVARRRLADRRADAAAGRLGGAPPGARARRLGVRVRQRLLPRRRRHRRGGARAAARRASRRRARRAAAIDARRSRWIEGMQSRAAAGAPSTPTTPRGAARAALLRLRRGDRPAERRRHRARRSRCSPRCGLADAEAGARAACAGCCAEQEPDGSWFGRWGANHVYGTGAVVPALVAAGVARRRPAHPPRGRAGSSDHQNHDGGWGEDPRSYVDPAAIGRGTSTASQTAWALLAPARRRRALAAVAAASASWSQPSAPTAAGTSRSTPAPASPGDFYINYHLYRLVFPIMALARCA